MVIRRVIKSDRFYCECFVCETVVDNNTDIDVFCIEMSNMPTRHMRETCLEEIREAISAKEGEY